MVEIPRSTFNFDFEYERRILAEAEENPNWSKFVVERQAPLPVPQQQASYIPPTSVFHISVILTWLPSDQVLSGSLLKKGLKLFMDLFWLLLLA